MGNRAVITTAPYANENIGIYVHWNGGLESIEGFLRAARKLGYRTPDPNGDKSYGLARLTAIIALFFGGETSIGINRCDQLDTDNGDNGVWLLGEGWKVVGRKHCGDKVPKLTKKDEEKADAIADTIIKRVEAAAKIKD